MRWAYTHCSDTDSLSYSYAKCKLPSVTTAFSLAVTQQALLAVIGKSNGKQQMVEQHYSFTFLTHINCDRGWGVKLNADCSYQVWPNYGNLFHFLFFLKILSDLSKRWCCWAIAALDSQCLDGPKTGNLQLQNLNVQLAFGPCPH